MGGITEIHENSLGMSDMQITIWFRWEPGVNNTTCCRDMLVAKMGMELGVLAWLV